MKQSFSDFRLKNATGIYKKKNWKSFNIISNTTGVVIQNKNKVKYLRINLDKFLYYNDHIKISIERAKNAFFFFKSLFYSKHLSKEVKVSMYKCLIRPILTYGCSIWYNIAPPYMEKLRLFERRCLRICTKTNRSFQSNFLKYVSDKKLYDTSQIMRIDNFIIKLIRNHISKIPCSTNELIFGPYFSSMEYLASSVAKGFVTPECFIYLDRLGLIQNEDGVPIFYHHLRRANDKAVKTDIDHNTPSRFERSISNFDIETYKKLKMTKYWWLNF